MADDIAKKDEGKIVEGGEIPFGQSDAKPDSLDQVVGSATSETGKGSSAGSGLASVPEHAIKCYAHALAGTFNVPKNSELFFAYLYEPKMKYSLEKDTHELSFVASSELLNHDSRECLRVITGRDLSDDEVNLIFGLDLTKPSGQINARMFPEMAALHFQESVRKDLENFGYAFEIMRLPPTGRTFYAGLLSAKQNNVGTQLNKSGVSDPYRIDLPFTTKEVFDYAEQIGIKDVGHYLRMLEVKKE
jgi:hypothetical protein